MAFEADQEPMLLALERGRAKELLTERHTLGDDLRARAIGVADVAGFTRWTDELREWEHDTVRALESIFTTGRAAAEFESQRVKRVSLERESHAERFDRRQEDLRLELANVMGLRDRLYSFEEAASSATATAPIVAYAGRARIFVVHGRENGPKAVVVQVLEQTRAANHEIVVLSESPAGIGELDPAADYIVVVASADDVGRPNPRHAPAEGERARADQNLIFDLGYLVAKLGPERVTVLSQRGTELPRQHPGVSYTELDAGGQWRNGLLGGLRNAGLAFDPSKLP